MSGSNSSVPDANVAPSEPLSFTVHNPPTLQVQQRTLNGRLKMLLVMLVCAAPVVASYFTYFVIRPEGRTNYSELVDPQRPLPDLPLADLQGKPFTASRLRGQWLLVVVGHGACDAGCERQLYIQRQLREALGREKERLDKVWFITDGQPPRPEVLNAITIGMPATVLQVPRQALAGWLSPAAGHALEDHLYIVDPMGNWMMRVPADADAKKLKRDLDRLLRGSASWDIPGR